MNESSSMILFGATGDLAQRKLYPALHRLYKKRKKPFAMIGVARRPYNHETFREMIKNSVEAQGETCDQSFLDTCFYFSLDVQDTENYRGLKELAEKVDLDFGLYGNRIFYLALAPEFFGIVTNKLKESGLTKGNGWKRLVIEKPFGRDLESAEILNKEIRSSFEEDEIYRIDHYLGKDMIQNIQVIRFANPIFESIWNNHHIANVQITSSETLGVEERASYYDRTGALMDMVQNHMLQMVALTAMEPPSRMVTEDIRDEKVKVLRSIRPVDVSNVGDLIVRGQYGSGTLPNGLPAIAYREEENISRDSETDTYVAAKLFIDNFRWAGVPFYIRTGKRLKTKSTEIIIQFKEAPANPYFKTFTNMKPNLLVIHVQPYEGITLKLNAKNFAHPMDTLPIKMEFAHTDEFNTTSEAYERLISDCMRGDSTNFTRWDEVALSWHYVDGIKEALKKKNPPLAFYESGTMGPIAADDLLAKDGTIWWPLSQ
ncbi:glucose-6-phosphate dehydrogenase [Pullulanibacillus sp. KACC 23026]|uniref:glucose-6-phosphate dehydrogenase n=1 Tax=Pullulanibacillus sp. KACC 23026 TaxID=3028315 RepID=UPI0023AEAF1F|nr:glucose-6-phosphate dehydrogenase [Pullulanibacillus sp. KACC 23026]WEG14951.1 glucose-6-phosphate dehydrogenase [Pullulanibacillus sp. KACC 23026]